MFGHPSGYQVETYDEAFRSVLIKLKAVWPRGLRVRTLFPNVGVVMDDLKLLHKNGLIVLRCSEPEVSATALGLQMHLTNHDGGYTTTPYHTREAITE
jgi:hypothetical protein